jgi:transposase-like protein
VLAQELRRRREDKVGRSWYVDEPNIHVRAIDRDGVLVDVMLSEHRNLVAATLSAKADAGVTPDRVTTDGPDADPRAIRAVLGKHVRIGRAGVSTTALSRITAA